MENEKPSDNLSLLSPSELTARIESHQTAIRYTEHTRGNSGRTKETIQQKREFAAKLTREADELEAMISIDSSEIIAKHHLEIDRCKAAKIVAQLKTVGLVVEAGKVGELSPDNVDQIKQLLGIA